MNNLNTLINTFDYVVNFDYLIIVNIFIAVICGLALKVALSFSNQTWVQTYHHTLAYALLPAITFVITKVISGNIALSLGMIGALSIVRFRNPVKNPLELVIYFALITIGISSSIKVIFGIALTIIIIIVVFFTNYFYSVLKKNKSLSPQISFGDGNSYNTIEVTCNENINEFRENNNLINLIENLDEKIFIYRFAFKTYEEAKKNLDEIDKYKDKIKSINTNRIN